MTFSIDDSQIPDGDFHFRIKVATAGQSIYVDIHGNKPPGGEIRDVGTS